jgi:hypothetical protein
MENERKYLILLEELKQRWNILHYNHVLVGREVGELKRAIQFMANTSANEMLEILSKIDVDEMEIQNEPRQS